MVHRALRVSWPILVSLGLALASTARADPPAPPVEDWQALDAEGTQLLDRGDHAQACPKFERSFELQPGTGVLMRLALCRQRLGRTASAWSTFRAAERRARASGDSAVASLAERRALELEPSLSTITIRLSPEISALPGVELRRDGVPVSVWAAADAQPVDPGVHVVVLTAPGRPPLHATVTVGAAAEHAVVVLGSEASSDRERLASPSDEPTKAPHRGLPPARIAALGAAGVGVAGLAVGAGLAIAAASAMDKARSLCPAHVGCSDAALALQSTAGARADAATVSFGIGAAALVGAAVAWWVPAALGARTSQAWHLAPAIGHDKAGLSFGSSF